MIQLDLTGLLQKFSQVDNKMASLQAEINSLKERIEALESHQQPEPTPTSPPAPTPTPTPVEPPKPTPTPTEPPAIVPFQVAKDLPAIAKFAGAPWSSVPMLVAVHPNGIESVTVDGVEAIRKDGDFFILPPIEGKGAKRVTAVVTPRLGKVSTVSIDAFLGEPSYKRLKKGSHSLQNLVGGSDTWLIVEPEQGLSKEDVKIIGGTNLKGKICLRNVTLAYPIKGDSNSSAALWLDNVEYAGSGSSKTGSDVSRFDKGEYWTNCYVHDLHLAGMSDLIVGCTVEDIGEDVARGYDTIINTVIRRVRDTSSHGDWHPDLGTQPNGPDDQPVLHYGVTVEDCEAEQFGVGGGHHYPGIAFVKCSIENRVAIDLETKFDSGDIEWLYLKDVEIKSGRFDLRPGKGKLGPIFIDNVKVQGRQLSANDDEIGGVDTDGKIWVRK